MPPIAHDTADRPTAIGSLVDAAYWTREYFSQPVPFSMLTAAIFMVCVIAILEILPAPTYQPSRSNHAHNTTSGTGLRGVNKAKKLNFVARITGLHNCRWSPEGRAPIGRDYLGIGRELKLDSGMVKITYYNGAKLVLEGPVEFTVEEANSCRLELGKLTANVSKKAVGFTVETPSTTIVDLGTEFGVVADQQGDTEVHVFRGVVEVEAAGAVKRRLGAGEAVRFTAGGTKAAEIALNEGCFAQRRQSVAGIVQAAGAVEFLDAAPRSVVPGSLEDDRRIFVFAERADVVLKNDLTVTVAGPDTDGPLRDQLATLPAGTCVSSYLLHFDPASHNGKVIGCYGSVKFDRQVLGVIVGDDQLAATDGILGAPETNYASDKVQVKNRGMEITNTTNRYSDIITISRDRRTVAVRCFHGRSTTDQFRVLVAGGNSKPGVEER